MRIWKKYNIDENSAEWCSCCLHDQLDLCWGELTSSDTSERLLEPQHNQCYNVKVAVEPQIKFTVESFYRCFYVVLLTALYQGMINK